MVFGEVLCIGSVVRCVMCFVVWRCGVVWYDERCDMVSCVVWSDVWCCVWWCVLRCVVWQVASGVYSVRCFVWCVAWWSVWWCDVGLCVLWSVGWCAEYLVCCVWCGVMCLYGVLSGGKVCVV